ncbi:MAG: hypothetical protein ACYC69_04415 [Thermodesulfovibrionales bacterium]
MLKIASVVVAVGFFFSVPSAAFMPDEEVAVYQRVTKGWPVGDRIAFWAEQFLGTPYDPDPLGVYVRDKAIVSDEKVDCMYLTFRSVELALAPDPPSSVELALAKRFRGAGVLEGDRVMNYSDRFEYGEDMIDSGKWGREITAELGRVEPVKGSRGRGTVMIIHRRDIMRHAERFRNGDIIFFVRSPHKRVSDEIIGHIGIIKKESEAVSLVHASGLKNKGGKVSKTLLADYIKTMPFIGIRATRFEEQDLMPE